MREVRQRRQNRERLASNLSGLLGIQSLCNQFLRIGINRLLKKEACESDAIVQGYQSLADQGSHFEQNLVLDFESGLNQIRLDPSCQIFGGEQADVSPI